MIMSELNVKNLKVVVFDWDNTLAQSRTALVFAVNQVLAEYGLPCWDEVKSRRDNNLSFRDNFPKIFGSNAQKAYEEYRKIYLTNVKNMIATFPMVKDVINFFVNYHIPVAVMSNKDRKLLDYELPLLFDRKLFTNIVAGHEAGHDKPDAEHLFWTVKDFVPADKINRQNVWMIGDSPQDSTCAKRAGALPIRIGRAIWDDNDDDKTGILFFDSFVDFYQTLLLSNAK